MLNYLSISGVMVYEGTLFSKIMLIEEENS